MTEKLLENLTWLSEKEGSDFGIQLSPVDARDLLRCYEALKASRKVLFHTELLTVEYLAWAHGHHYSAEFEALSEHAAKLTQEVLT